MTEIELERQRCLEGSGLGEAILGPVRVENCEVTLHRREAEAPMIASLREQGARLPAWLREIGHIVAVSVCSDGSCGEGGPLRNGLGSTGGDRQLAVYGLLPVNSTGVEVRIGDRKIIPAQVGEGAFLAAVPSDARQTVAVRFSDSTGAIVAEWPALAARQRDQADAEMAEYHLFPELPPEAMRRGEHG